MNATVPRGADPFGIGTAVPPLLRVDHRPRSLAELKGQDMVRRNLSMKAARFRTHGAVPKPIALFGESGWGKTTLAKAFAYEMGTTVHIIFANKIKSWDQLQCLFEKAKRGDVIFIDEAHELTSSIQHNLYEVFEDGAVSVMDAAGETDRVKFNDFCLVLATTHEGLLTGPLRNRFGYKGYLQPYSSDVLSEMVVSQAMRVHGWRLDASVGLGIGMISQGTPRVALGLLESVVEVSESCFASLPTDPKQMAAMFRETVKLQSLDPLLGLPMGYRKVLLALSLARGGNIGLAALASKTGEAKETIETAIEPYLMRATTRFKWDDVVYEGALLDRGSKCRALTKNGRVYMDACRNAQAHGYMSEEFLG
jgi:Holliday junction DNA helicase RuvB